MPETQSAQFRLGDTVKIRGYDAMVGRVYELRGPLGPKGTQVYRIKFRRKPRPEYVEVFATQMELVASAN